ncbi:MAG: penicillin acylase family protein [Opitutaceae bacterium]|nr:penicillin acylase family protein [Opitutaceae bacterium]
MASPLVKRFSLLFSFLSLLLLVAAVAGGIFYYKMRQSLPPLDGEGVVAGLGAPVRIERDSLGVPTLTGGTRTDVAGALGYVHAQDRFFQMDVLRRRAAGELAELFGEAAVPLDSAARLHGFRAIAREVLARTPPAERAIVDAYVAGVNAGLNALRGKPWEYLALRAEPVPWQAEDTVLTAHALWLDLQKGDGSYEQCLRAVQFSLGSSALKFFAPLGSSWDAALDGSTLAEAPTPPIKLTTPPAKTSATAPAPAPDAELVPGSNSCAIAGSHTENGAALLANDMHLHLGVPNVWYRASLKWTDANGGSHRVTGVTLPGSPNCIAGSNGRLAWGFTNAQIDTSDVVVVESDGLAQVKYRTVRGWVDIAERTETIKVKGDKPVQLVVRSTEWGPIVNGPDQDFRYYAIRWNAHNPDATNFGLLDLETATTLADGLAVAHRCGMPNQNILLADSTGAIAWTVTGRIPRRIGFDGRLPVSWTYSDRKWDGWVKPEDVPTLQFSGKDLPGDAATAGEGLLWTANNRPLGGAALSVLGDGGYDNGARAGQIRDDLRALVAAGRKISPQDLLGVQLDDRAVFLERWQKLLLSVLTDQVVASKKPLAEMRDTVRQWNGHAGVDSAAYHLVRAWRSHVAERVFAPIFDQAGAYYADFRYTQLHYEDPLWRLVNERPARLLDPLFLSWDDLLLSAARDVVADADQAGTAPAHFTWGARNTLHMQHPFSRFLPGPAARLLDMPAEALPGDNNMPRVQSPDFGASERMVVAPGHEDEGLFHMPGGQSGHVLSPYYRAGHAAWARGEPSPFLPGPTQHTFVLKPASGEAAGPQ